MNRRIALGFAAFVLLASCDDIREAAGPETTGSVILTAWADSFRVNLAWRASGQEVEEYVVEGSLGDTNHFMSKATLGPDDSTWSDTTATSDHDRWYRIVAHGASASFASSVVKCRPLLPPVPVGDTTSPLVDTLKGVPPLLRATPDSFAIVLDWSLSAVPSVDGFVLERSVGDTLGFTEVARIPRKDTAWTDTSAKTAGTRWYRIRLRTGAAVSKPSAKVPAEPLLPLAALEARQNGRKVGTLDVAMGSALAVVPLVNTGAVDLEISSIQTTRAWLNASMDDSALPVGGSRLLRLDLDTATIKSTGTRVATVTINTIQGASTVFVVLVVDPTPDTLERPVLRLDSVKSSEVRLSWSSSGGDGIETAILQRKRASDSVFVDVDTLRNVRAAKWVDSGLAGRETFHYRMVARDSTGDTAISNVVEAKTPPRSRLVVSVRDAKGQFVQGAAASGPDGIVAGVDGTISLEDIDSADSTSWEFRADGYLSRWIVPRLPATGSDTLTLVMVPDPSMMDLAEPTGTDFRGGALVRDTSWIVDGSASGSVLLLGHDVTGSPRPVRRVLGQAVLTGSPGMVVRSGSIVATSLPSDGSVVLASILTNSVKRVAMPDTVGSPWGLGACPDGIAVAGSEGVAVIDSAGRIFELHRHSGRVDDASSLHGSRVVCTKDMLYIADNGDANGLVRMARGTGVLAKADLRGRTTARFLAADTSVVAAGTVAGGTHAVHLFDMDLKSKGMLDLGAGTEIVALTMARDGQGEAIAVAALRRNGEGMLAIVDPSGHLRGTMALEDVPVDLSSQGESILVVYPDHASLVYPAAD